MTITTLKIGLLTPAELQQLSHLTREVRSLSGHHYSLLDPELIPKLHCCLKQIGAQEQVQELEQLARRLIPSESAKDAVKVEKYRKYGVRVKYYDQPAAA